MTKYIFVTGGNVSSLGKGITSATIGRLLKNRGLRVTIQKIDPYLNVDAGTMNPFQHGEVFVTDDGTETDLDLGHYERFMSISLDRRANFTSGAVFRTVLDRERKGEFLGKTIQFVPHVTDEIKRRIYAVAESEKLDFVIVEIGGTMGADMEVQPYAEAIRQIRHEVGRGRAAHIHVVKMDYVFPSDEAKTKPIQHSVRATLEMGLMPDVLVVRAKRTIGEENLRKISLFCGVEPGHVIEAMDLKSIYEVPIRLQENGLLRAVFDVFSLEEAKKDLKEWRRRYARLETATREVRIGIVGKYHNHTDGYISVNEALLHAAAKEGVSLIIEPIDAEGGGVAAQVKRVDGILVPGGYGERGVEGMLRAITYAREKKVPYLGLCYGLQLAVIERARNVLKLKGADSHELNQETEHPVIAILDEQKTVTKMGGTQRLGSYPAHLVKGSIVSKAYRSWHGGTNVINERHRHRYEVNPAYAARLTESGLLLSGFSPDGSLVEFIELPEKEHPFFVATQAHPEFKSRFLEPHPLFECFLRKASESSLKGS